MLGKKFYLHLELAPYLMSSKLQSQKNGGHFKRRAAIGRRNNRITTRAEVNKFLLA